jgi:cathepsin F
VAVVLLFALFALASAARSRDEISFRKFVDYNRAHGKSHASFEEFAQKFSNFKDSLIRIDRRNQEHGTPVFGLNKFSDMSVEEFKAKYLGYRGVGIQPNEVMPSNGGPSNVDWRTKGAVSPVKDQEQCGSCWAFSTTEEVESMWFLSKGTLPVLAPQQIVNCDKNDNGCNGGDTVSAYSYVESAGGLVPESDFPYTGTDGSCKYDKTKVVAPVKGFKYATPPCNDSCSKQDEGTLGANLASVGPVSICVYAESWQDYTSGVLTKNCPKSYSSLDHCVQLVGYSGASTDETGKPSPAYWIVRNSWNTDWGLDGYIHIAYGSNLCGIADEATIVTF